MENLNSFMHTLHFFRFELAFFLVKIYVYVTGNVERTFFLLHNQGIHE